MRKLISTSIFIALCFLTQAQSISGSTSTSLDAIRVYTFNDGVSVPGRTWTVNNRGTILRSWLEGTLYSVEIQFVAAGTASITFGNLNGETFATLNVSVTAPPPPLLGGDVGDSQYLCYGNAATSWGGSASGGSGGHEYTWQRQIPNSWEDYASGSSFTPTISGNWRRKVRSGDGQVAYSNTVESRFYEDLSPGTIDVNGPVTYYVCYNETPDAFTTTNASGGDGSYQYQWEQSVIPSGSWTAISGATSANYSPPLLSTNLEFRRKVTSCGQTKYSNSDWIYVRRQYTPYATISEEGNQTLCIAEVPELLRLTEADGEIQWQSRTIGGSWTDIAGANGGTYQPPGPLATFEYRVEMTTECDDVTVYSNIVTVTANAYLNASDIASENTYDVCYGQSFPTLGEPSVSGGDGSYDYQWQMCDSPSSDCENFYDLPIGIKTMTPSEEGRYRRITTSCNQEVISEAIIVRTHGDLSPGSISISKTLICENADPGIFTSSAGATGGNGVYAYQWQSRQEGGNWNDVVSATGSTYDPGTIGSNTEFRRRVTSCSITKYSNVIAITIEGFAPGQIGLSSVDHVFASGCGAFDPGSIGSSVDAFGQEGITYQWYKNEGAGWEPISGATGNQYNTPVANVSTLFRRAAVTEGGCVRYSNIAEVIVYPDEPSGTVASTVMEFYGSGIGTLSIDSKTGDVTQWETDASGSWQPISGATSNTYDFSITESTSFRAVMANGACPTSYTTSPLEVTEGMYLFTGYLSGTDVLAAGNTTVAIAAMDYDGSVTGWQLSYDGSTVETAISQATPSLSYTGLTQSAYFRAVLDGGAAYTPWKKVTVLPADETPYGTKTEQLIALEEVTTALTASTALQSGVYADGFGRSVQSYNHEVAAGKHLVSFADYDSLGRATRQYLPYISSTTAFTTTPIAEQSSYYASPGAGVAASDYPYAVTSIDDTYQRVTEQGAPGADWQPGSGHTVRHTYAFNAANEVRRWHADGTSSGYYAASELRKHITTDENGHTVTTYHDALGQTIQKSVEADATTMLHTCQVYDAIGRLAATIPPKAFEEMTASGTYDISLAGVAELIYTYTYDDAGRLIARKVPGKGAEYLVYDPMDRVALTQDAILRADDQWLFTKRDQRGRTVYSGRYTDAATREALQATFDALDYDGADAWHETKAANSSTHGYTNAVYPTQNLEVLSVTYYDDYDFDRDGAEDYTLDASHLSGQSTTLFHTTRGLTTGSKTRLLDTDDWLTTTQFYDEKGRVLQVQGNNHLDLDAIDKVTYRYDFTGTVTERLETVMVNGETTTQHRRYTHDDRKRLLTTQHQLNGGDWITLHELTYNELGQLMEKNLHISPEAEAELAEAQSIDYTYNIRGWLTGINSATADDGEGDLFGMELLYNAADGGLGNTPAYNGNISGVKWTSYSDEETDVTARGYAYSYDHADRLSAAASHIHTGSWASSGALAASNITYDANGNLLTLDRTDATGNTLDALSYQYHQNQLMSVSDAGHTNDGFSDGHTDGDDYLYDVNGNQVQDLNKGITSIQYNYLDLPTVITLSPPDSDPDPEPVEGAEEADSLTYRYSASGTKLQMTAWSGGQPVHTIDHVGGMRYEDGVLKSIAHEDGRIVLGHPDDPDYQYYLTDHQGNTRRVLSTAAEAYATGEDFEDSDSEFQELNLQLNTNANTTAGGSMVQLLQAGETGALVLLKMDKGDTVDLQVQANYESEPTGNTFLGTAFNALFTTFDNAYGGAEGIQSTATAFENALGAGVMNTKDAASDAPRAYLNYIFFDVDMNFVAAGFEPVTTAAYGIGVHEAIAIEDIIAHQPGYLLGYLSNENTEAVNIHFDDFTVRHAKTNVVQAIDYYPYGMQATTFTRTAADPTQYLYNGGVEQNDYTSYYETFFRNYDASIGRFTGIDIYASSFSSQTPYNYAFNSPTVLNDPLGDYPQRMSVYEELQNGLGGNCHTCDAAGGGGGLGSGGLGWSNGMSYGGTIGYDPTGMPSAEYYMMKGDVNNVAGFSMSHTGLDIDFSMLASGSYTFGFGKSGISGFYNASVGAIAGSWFGGPRIAAGSQTMLYGNIGGTEFFGRDYNLMNSVVDLDSFVDISGVNPDLFYLNLYSSQGVGSGPSGDDSYKFIPVVGSLSDAYVNYKDGDYGWGTFNAAMGITDAVPVLRLGKLAFKGVKAGFKKFTKRNARHNLKVLTGQSGARSDAHHIFPQADRFVDNWKRAGILHHSPTNMAWWEKHSHRSAARGYNTEWDRFFRDYPNASTQQILDFGDDLMKSYGF